MDAESYYQGKCGDIIRTRTWTTVALQELGFRVLPSCTNFVFAKSVKIGGQRLYEELKKRGILVRHFTNPRICEYNRITIGTPEQMAKFIETVKKILED